MTSTEIHKAIGKGDTLRALDLIAQGNIEVNVSNHFGDTPLHSATKFENRRVISALLKAGAEVNAIGFVGVTPLIDITASSLTEFGIEIATELLNHGADVDSEDNWGETALHYAVFHNKIDYVKLLLSFKANVNVADKENVTPMTGAICRQFTEIIKLLESHDPRVHDDLL